MSMHEIPITQPEEESLQKLLPPIDVPLPEPSRFLVNQISGDLKSNCNHGCFYNREDADNAASYLGTYWSGTEGVFTAEQLHQYAEAYANAKVAAERERCAARLEAMARSDSADGLPQNIMVVSALTMAAYQLRLEAFRANQKGTV